MGEILFGTLLKHFRKLLTPIAVILMLLASRYTRVSHFLWIFLIRFILKSVVCYRTGLDVQKFSPEDTEEQFKIALQSFKETGRLRVSHKALNDFIVNCVLKVSAISKKPGIYYFKSIYYIF